MGAVIGALTGSDDKSEVAVMAKQATEVNIIFICFKNTTKKVRKKRSQISSH